MILSRAQIVQDATFIKMKKGYLVVDMLPTICLGWEIFGLMQSFILLFAVTAA